MRNLKFYAFLFFVTPSWAGTVFTEDFSSLTINQNSVGSGAPLQCSGGIPTNKVTFFPNPSTFSSKWSFHSSGVYPIGWSGSNSTAAWAVSGNQMYFHGVKGPNDDGHAILSKATFDKSKIIIASADIRAYCSNGSGGCWAGIAIITEESNYRGLYLGSIPGGQVQIQRLAPCNAQQTSNFYPANTWQNLTVEYNGPRNSWSYYINGQRIQSTSALSPAGLNNFVNNGIENSQANNTDVVLLENPRVGIYTNANQLGTFVEGGVKNLIVKELNKITPFSASASSTYGSQLPKLAIDNDPNTAWISGTGGSQWIEIDLGSVKEIHKIRLLTEQSITENTEHKIFTGTSPSPTNLSDTISGITSTAQWIEKNFLPTPLVARYIKIETSISSSWRAWREIEIYE